MKLLVPDYCRKQAKEVGAQSEELRNHSVKRDLIRITRSYHLLAELAESRQKSVAKQTEARRIGTKAGCGNHSPVIFDIADNCILSSTKALACAYWFARGRRSANRAYLDYRLCDAFPQMLGTCSPAMLITTLVCNAH